MITVFERVGDTFLSWVPMYSEAKVAFFIYLWYPKTKGTTYVYDSFFRPYLAKHETEIDRNLLELRARCADFAVLYWQKATSYGQTRVFDIIQYISAQSTPPRPQPTQQQQGTSTQPPAVKPNLNDCCASLRNIISVMQTNKEELLVRMQDTKTGNGVIDVILNLVEVRCSDC